MSHKMSCLLHKYPDIFQHLNNKTVKKQGKKRRNLRRNNKPPQVPSMLKKITKSVHVRKQFEEFFNLLSRKTVFMCPLCREMLDMPVTVGCGHTFCKKCVVSIENCVVCSQEVDNQSCTNVVMQKLLDKWKEARSNFNNLSEHILSSTSNIMGVEPRYFLRSRIAGLQFQEKESKNNTKHCEHVCDTTLVKNKKTNQKLTKCSSNDVEKRLENIFQEVENIQANSLKMVWNTCDSDLDCILCGECLLEPVTTACGHSFCKECLTRVLDHRLNCPLCMNTLNIDDYFRGITIDLDEAVRLLLPNEWKERKLARFKQISLLENKFEVPVFICTNAFPGVACPLYVYEPQYRLLTRRCLQTTTRRFAMVAKDTLDNKYVSYGTLLEVRDAVSLQDGRFILATVGLRRFRILNKGEQDGYDFAKIQYIRDSAVPLEKLSEIETLHQRVYVKASKWVNSLTPKVFEEVERLIGNMPEIEHNWWYLPDGPSWTWWLMPILPLSSQLQVVFLSTTSLEKRLRAIDKMLEHMKIRMKALERDSLNNVAAQPFSETCDELDFS